MYIHAAKISLSLTLLPYSPRDMPAPPHATPLVPPMRNLKIKAIIPSQNCFTPFSPPPLKLPCFRISSHSPADDGDAGWSK